MEKQYYPYSKWFGTAFNKLRIAKTLSPVLKKVLASQNWKERENHLATAYKIVTAFHNSLRLTKPIPTKVSDYYGRPYLVIHGDEIAKIIKNEIKSKEVKNIKVAIGSVDQFTDSTDVTESLELCKQLEMVYKEK